MILTIDKAETPAESTYGLAFQPDSSDPDYEFFAKCAKRLPSSNHSEVNELAGGTFEYGENSGDTCMTGTGEQLTAVVDEQSAIDPDDDLSELNDCPCDDFSWAICADSNSPNDTLGNDSFQGADPADSDNSHNTSNSRMASCGSSRNKLEAQRAQAKAELARERRAMTKDWWKPLQRCGIVRTGSVEETMTKVLIGDRELMLNQTTGCPRDGLRGWVIHPRSQEDWERLVSAKRELEIKRARGDGGEELTKSGHPNRWKAKGPGCVLVRLCDIGLTTDIKLYSLGGRKAKCNQIGKADVLKILAASYASSGAGSRATLRGAKTQGTGSVGASSL